MYAVHYSKANILSNNLTFPSYDVCNNKQGNFYYQLFVFLEA